MTLVDTNEPDLELLASEDREDAIRDSGIGISRSVQALYSRLSDVQPSQFSRFFDCEFLQLNGRIPID